MKIHKFIIAITVKIINRTTNYKIKKENVSTGNAPENPENTL